MNKKESLERLKRNGLIIAVLGALLMAFGGYEYFNADYEIGQLDQMTLE